MTLFPCVHSQFAFHLQYRGNTQGDGSIHLWGKKDPRRAVREGLPNHFDRLWRFCVALTGQKHLGDDLAQMTCLRALEKAEQFKPGTHLDRWLFVMARRLWLNELRRDAIRKTESFSALESEDPEAQISSSETNIFARQVFQKMNALPEAQRVTALLVLVEGYTYAETAELLDIPPGTVMSRISAARKTLAAQIEPATGTDA